MKKIDKLTINLDEWGRGVNSPGQLSDKVNDEGEIKYCCLGLLGRALGVYQHNDLENFGILSHVLGQEESEKLGLFKLTEHYSSINVNRTAENVLASINDAQNIDEETRQSWIRAGFKHWLGIEVTFDHQQ